MEAYPLISFSWLGLTWYGFGLALFVGGLMAFALLQRTAKAYTLPAGAAGQLMLLAVVLGLVFSRLVFSAFSWQRVFLDPMEGTFLGLKPLFQVTQGGLSLYGMLLGVLLACWAFARLHRKSTGTVLDWAAVPLAVFSAFALGAQMLGGAGFGEEVALFLQWFPAAVRNAFDEWNAAIFAYQALTALLIALWLWRSKAHSRPGDRMLRLLIPLNALQLFFEALRQDDYPRLASNAFIRVNQLLALAFLVAVLIALTRRNPRRSLWLWGSLLVAAGAVMAAEFNEKLPLPRELLYAFSFAAVLGLSVLWLRALPHMGKQGEHRAPPHLKPSGS